MARGTRALTAGVLCATALAVPAHGFARVPHNPADRMARVAIDPFRYDYARRCLHHPQRGTLALESWLEQNWRGESWGIMRCERLSGKMFSLHSEGRALDWHLSVHVRRDKLAAQRLIRLLLAPDGAGNAAALARRMGVEEIIWNCTSWSSGQPAMHPYSVCAGKRHIDDTTAHRDHVHLGVNWPGARMETSFWRQRVS